jgi:hypothetical protein
MGWGFGVIRSGIYLKQKPALAKLSDPYDTDNNISKPDNR